VAATSAVTNARILPCPLRQEKYLLDAHYVWPEQTNQKEKAARGQ
jgi:hypothetical protein